MEPTHAGEIKVSREETSLSIAYAILSENRDERHFEARVFFLDTPYGPHTREFSQYRRAVYIKKKVKKK